MTSLLLAIANDSQNVEEEVDDIEIEEDGRVDVFLRRHLPKRDVTMSKELKMEGKVHAYFVHDDLSVDNDEEGKEECSANRNRFVKQLTLEENLKTTTTTVTIDT